MLSIVTVLILTSVSQAAAPDPIEGAFGIALGESAAPLEANGFFRYESPNQGVQYLKIEQDGLLTEKTVTVSPISETIMYIQGSRFYKDASLGSCRNDFRLVSDTIEKKYPSIKTNSEMTWGNSEFFTHQYASRLVKAPYSSRFSAGGRTITLTCSVQNGGGSSLIVRYAIGAEEWKALNWEDERYRQDRKNRAPTDLKKRGLDPDEL